MVSWCEYCSVPFQFFILRHLMIAPFRYTNKLTISYLFRIGWGGGDVLECDPTNFGMNVLRREIILSATDSLPNLSLQWENMFYTQTGLSALAESKDQDRTDTYKYQD